MFSVVRKCSPDFPICVTEFLNLPIPMASMKKHKYTPRDV